MGYEIAPRNVQSRRAVPSFNSPLAPIQTMAGNRTRILPASYNPFIQGWLLSPILGIPSTINSKRLHQKKAFFITPSFEIRKSRRPAKNGYRTRTKPVYSCPDSSDQPPMTSPWEFVKTKWTSMHPARNTRAESTRLENRRTKSP